MIRTAFFCILSALVLSCATTRVENSDFDKKLINPQYSRVQKKAVIGLLYFADNRKDASKGELLSLTQFSNLKQAVIEASEEILKTHNGFSSVIVISPLDLKDISDANQLNKMQKLYNLDYFFSGEIKTANLDKVELDTRLGYKWGVFFSTGIFPEPYEYRSNFEVTGKLVSAIDNKLVWQGSGASSVRQVGKLVKSDVFRYAMQNALNRMYSDMSRVFGLQIKEVN